MKKIFLCAISNVASGTCHEDCGFCTQSVKWKAKIDRYKEKPIDQIITEAKAAKSAGAVGFCLVTAGKTLDDKTLSFVAKAATAITKEGLNLKLIACNGIASKESLKELKSCGVGAYNHNLETSQNFYKTICSTHDWQERYQTCENINSVGLNLVCGGIFGLGESNKDRIDLIQSVKSLNPKTVPINFFISNSALPIQKAVVPTDEALFWVKKAREILGANPRIMLAGGKELAFKDRLLEAIPAGANALVVGNYLTTKGMGSDELLNKLTNGGYEVATFEDCKGEKNG